MIDLRGAWARVLAGELVGRAVASRLALRAPPITFDLIALGKGAGAMTDVVLRAWGPSLRRGVVVLADGAPRPADDARLRVMVGAHPIPDARSVVAGEAALEIARAGEGSELVVLVSGGSSSLALVPIAGVTLDTVAEVSRVLLASGADVKAINVVRRHLSQVHGGGLLRAAAGRAVTAYLVSDVIDGAPHDVGSGPAVSDPTTVDDARRVLARYAPGFVGLRLGETWKGSAGDGAATWEIAREPGDLANAFAEELRRAGYVVRVLPPSTGDVEALAEEYVRLAGSLAAREAVVRVAEPSVRVTAPHPGAGGRCTHLAALVARALPPGVQFLAAASDGVDGGSGTGGAAVEGGAGDDGRAQPSAALEGFDTGTFHRARGTALPMGPTGVNFADLHALVRERRETGRRRDRSMTLVE